MDAEAPCRFALAQPLDLAGVTNPSVQLHREHPPPSSSFRPSSRKASGRYSLAPPRPGHSAGRLRGTLSHCRLHALHRLIKEPLFREWPRPPEEHHDLKPLLLAVQFVFSARTLNEQKRASAIALALESIPGGNLGREAILQELRTKG